MKTSYRKDFWLTFLANFLFFSSHTVLYNLAPYLSILGMNKTFIGLFMNTNSIGLILYVIILGHYTEKIGKKRLLIITYILEVFSYISMFIFSKNALLLIILKFFASFSFAAGFTINSSIAFDILPPERRKGGIALFGISGIISNPFSAFLGEKIILLFGYKTLFIFGIVFAIFTIIITFFLPEKKYFNNLENYGENNFFQIIRRKELKLYLYLGFILGGAFSTLATFIPVYTFEKFNSSKLSTYFIFYALTAITLRLSFFKKLDTIKEEKLILFSLSSMFLSMVNMVFLLTESQLIFTGILYGISHGILYPLLNATVVKLSKEEEKYLVNSAYITIYTAGNITISIILGGIADLLRSNYIFSVMGILTLFSLILSLYKTRKK